jgi:hypothetical protein
MKGRKGSILLLIVAGIVSFGLTWFGVVGLLFFGVASHGLIITLVLVVPALAFPLFLTVFKSVNVARILMWGLLIASAVVTGINDPKHPMGAIVLSRVCEAMLVIAALTQGGYSLRRTKAVG